MTYGIAVALKTNSGSVFINPVNVPLEGQVLTAISATQCEWVTPPVSYTVSFTSLTISYGIKIFTIAKSNKVLQIGDILAMSNTNGSGIMIGQVVTIADNVVNLDVFSITGSGTFANWEVGYGILTSKNKYYYSMGLLQTETSPVSWIPERSLRLSKITATVQTAPSANIKINILKNGNTIQQLTILKDTLISDTLNVNLTLLDTDTITVNTIAASGRDLTINFTYF